MACRVGVICLPGAIKKTSFFNNTIQLTTIPSNVAALTRREKEVYHLMTKNYSNREIANKLYISEPTVKTHVSSILRKLGKKNRAQAIVYSYQIGLQEDSR
ncbi:MAG: response regulator transcription factor [Firmicutes bacterium]|nr:response regulator transcription factor [Bacillota bacterium]